MNYISRTKELLIDLVDYLGDSYYDFEGVEKKGKGNYNKLVNDKALSIDEFTLGKYKSLNTSFLFIGVNNVNAVRDGYVGSEDGYKNLININIKVYKQLKPNDAYFAYNLIPLVLNQLVRDWLNDNDKFTFINPSITISEPAFDVNTKSNTNPFLAVQGISFEVLLSFEYYTAGE